jgi:hypothetical protein
MNAKEIAAAINATKIAEVIKMTDGPTSVQIVHRVAPKQLSTWLGVLEFVLSRKQGWDEHICKRYFYQSGKIRYAWNFIIQWKNPKKKEEVLTQIQKNMLMAAQAVPQIFHQLESYPLVGAKEGRNVPQGAWNLRASGPMTGGLSQKGAHKL